MADILDRVSGRLAAVGTPAKIEPGVRSSSAIARFVEGMTDGAQLRAELAQLGYHGINLDRLVTSALLDLQLKQWKASQGQRPSTIGLILTTETVQRPSTIGLQMVLSEGETALVTPLRRSTIGLALLSGPAPTVPVDRRRASAVGLTLLTQGPPPRAPRPALLSTIGLEVRALTPSRPAPERPRPSTIGLEIIVR